MAAHRVAEDGLPGHIGWKLLRDQLRQLLSAIGVHPIVGCVRFLRGVDIETGALAELPIIRFVRDSVSTRAGIRADDDKSQFSGKPAILTLFYNIHMSAGQAGEVPEHGSRSRARLWRHKQGEGHSHAYAWEECE